MVAMLFSDVHLKKGILTNLNTAFVYLFLAGGRMDGLVMDTSCKR